MQPRRIRLPRPSNRLLTVGALAPVLAAVFLVAPMFQTSADAAKPTATRTVTPTMTVTAPAQTVTVTQPPVTTTVTAPPQTVTVTGSSTTPPSSTTTTTAAQQAASA